MNKKVILCAAALVGLGLVGRAGAQTLDVGPPDQPAPSETPEGQPPDAPASPPPEAPPSQPPEAAPAAPPEAAPTPPAAPAAAAAFGEAWHYAISIERAFGIDHISTTDSSSGMEVQSSSVTNFSLFGTPSVGARSVFSFPRAAFDLFVSPDLSVGLGLGVFKGSATGTSGFSNTESSIGLTAMPRVGYAWHLAPDVALWPRVGLSVVYLKTTVTSPYNSGELPAHYVAATVEAPFVFTLVPRVALTVGPTLDVTFVGKSAPAVISADGQPLYDERITEFGIQVGLLIDI